MAKQAVATVDTSSNLPSHYDYGQDAGAGFEGLTSSDYLVPMFNLVQSNSPEIANGVEGVKVGDFIIRALGETFSGKDGVAMVICGTDHVYCEWVPREAGGGMVKQYAVDDPVVLEAKRGQPAFGKIKMANGNDLIETFYQYNVLLTPDGDVRQVVVPFTSTKIGLYKGTMTKARSILVPTPDGGRQAAPLFAHRFRFKTQQIKKNNYTWHNYAITFDGKDATEARLVPSDALYQDARSFYQMVKDGAVKADTSKEVNGADDGASSSGGSGQTGEQIPF